MEVDFYDDSNLFIKAPFMEAKFIHTEFMDAKFFSNADLFFDEKEQFMSPIFMESHLLKHADLFISYVETPKSNLGKIIAGVGITATGLLCYAIPGIGWAVGGIITSAGISGLL